MTEEDAKTKWCPFVRLGQNRFTSPTNHMGSPNTEKAFFCIASDCMMWEWLGPQCSPSNKVGYCGLKGKKL
jgi:hypothetical protein